MTHGQIPHNPKAILFERSLLRNIRILAVRFGDVWARLKEKYAGNGIAGREVVML